MKEVITSVVIFVIAQTLHAQVDDTVVAIVAKTAAPVTISRDTMIDNKRAIILTNGLIIKVGDDLRCGRGTKRNGDFKYITFTLGTIPYSATVCTVFVPTPKNEKPRYHTMHLASGCSRSYIQVKEILKFEGKKGAYRYYILAAGNIYAEFHVELEEAIAAGEIVI